MLSIVVTCYNKWEIIKQVFDKLKDYKQSEIITVDNHPPYKNASKNIKEYCEKHGFKYIDVGKNIGCHQGYSLGFKKARGDFLVKNNDSIKPPSEADLQFVEAFLKRHKEFAYLSINFREDYFGETGIYDQKLIKKEGFEIAVMEKGIVNFACVIIPRRIFEEFGDLKPAYTKANGEFVTDCKYGGEEAYYQFVADSRGYKTGTILNLRVSRVHGENVIYTAWKYAYGFLGTTKLEFEEFKENKGAIKTVMENWINSNNGFYVEKAKEWLIKNA